MVCCSSRQYATYQPPSESCHRKSWKLTGGQAFKHKPCNKSRTSIHDSCLLTIEDQRPRGSGYVAEVFRDISGVERGSARRACSPQEPANVPLCMAGCP